MRNYAVDLKHGWLMLEYQIKLHHDEKLIYVELKCRVR